MRPSNESLFLPSAYRRRLGVDYFDDPVSAAADVVWQPDVYGFAAHLANRLGASSILDIGCGNGDKVAALASRFQVVGVDFGSNVRLARSRHPEMVVLDLNLETELESLGDFVPGAMIICCDVLEHLTDPTALLDFLRDHIELACGLVISTPDRDVARGHGDLGPPENPHHTREWSKTELAGLLGAYGLQPIVHGNTRSHSTSPARETQVALVSNRLKQRSGSSRSNLSTLALMPVFNEVDIVEETVSRALADGHDIYVMDNWSTDGCWELLNGLFSGSPRVQLGRWPNQSASDSDWHGILEHLDKVAASTRYDWIVRIDADEVLESSVPGSTLVDMIGLADSGGFDTLDFTCLTFRPASLSPSAPFLQSMKLWEIDTQPGSQSAERAWKNLGRPVGLAELGGHKLAGSRRVFPLNMCLRHFPLRTPLQARTKIFRDRLPRFARERTERGWHTHYDSVVMGSEFSWDESLLQEWSEQSVRDWVVEITTRVGLPALSAGPMESDQRELEELVAVMAQRDAAIAELYAIKMSRWWRMGAPYRRLRRLL